MSPRTVIGVFGWPCPRCGTDVYAEADDLGVLSPDPHLCAPRWRTRLALAWRGQDPGRLLHVAEVPAHIGDIAARAVARHHSAARRGR